MKYKTVLVFGLCIAFLALPLAAEEVADSWFAGTPTGADPATVDKQTDEDAGAVVGEKEGDGSRAGAGKAKRAGTGTAASYLYDQVRNGNVKIEVSTDAGAPP